jgi:hypothetical protein
MRILLAAAAALLTLASAGATPAASAQPRSAAANTAPQKIGDMPVINPEAYAPGNCPPISRYEAAKRGGKLRPQKLNELPMADAYNAVLRHIDGCNAPVMVGYGFGAVQH